MEAEGIDATPTGSGSSHQCGVRQEGGLGLRLTNTLTNLTQGTRDLKQGNTGLRIVNNQTKEEDAEFGEFPWQVILFDSNDTYICGGTFVGDQYVITAAHCVDK